MFEGFFIKYKNEVDKYREKELNRFEIICLSVVTILGVSCIICSFFGWKSFAIIYFMAFIAMALWTLWSAKRRREQNLDERIKNYDIRISCLIKLLQDSDLYTVKRINWLILCAITNTTTSIRV